ncbi:7-cyano-7-deazaguanosine (preQ0) biosynthesis protein QueE [Micromonospora sp. Llam0]|uniref:7-carboxy-7-deazaguanine synthase QueE n=1 Tax=Micromonospora sp. Llam0 TaxID=2485143 RepID=UPI000F483347|nr:7-carboxy-7-deazaguanine synthase QueE [Micromonospora sp. Llam0]ROO51616.1 7-cyano-7-deazaguanosine (preQ0) biosynthesis protein QueE [Micromonospora sp. Llam0]
MITVNQATLNEGNLRVSELFGPTLQGEGPSAGQRALFVRLAGCNLDCAWCDTPWTWDWSRFDPAEESREMELSTLVDWVLGREADLIVISGGEPMIQHRRLLPLVSAIRSAGRRVEIETNATVAPHHSLVDLATFNASPKLAGSGVPASRRIRPAALRALRACGKTVFKFVVSDHADVAELVDLQHRYQLAPVWVMPQGVTEEAVVSGMRALTGPALAHGWHLTPRLHVLLWGNERGR